MCPGPGQQELHGTPLPDRRPTPNPFPRNVEEETDREPRRRSREGMQGGQIRGVLRLQQTRRDLIEQPFLALAVGPLIQQIGQLRRLLLCGRLTLPRGAVIAISTCGSACGYSGVS